MTYCFLTWNRGEGQTTYRHMSKNKTSWENFWLQRVCCVTWPLAMMNICNTTTECDPNNKGLKLWTQHIFILSWTYESYYLILPGITCIRLNTEDVSNRLTHQLLTGFIDWRCSIFNCPPKTATSSKIAAKVRDTPVEKQLIVLAFLQELLVIFSNKIWKIVRFVQDREFPFAYRRWQKQLRSL